MEKSLKRLEGVKTVEVSLEKATATLTFKMGAKVNPGLLQKTVDKAGFESGRVTLTVTGTMAMWKKEEKNFDALKVSGSNQIFVLQMTDKLKELKDAIEAIEGEVEATVSGEVRSSEQPHPAMIIDSFEIKQKRETK